MFFFSLVPFIVGIFVLAFYGAFGEESTVMSINWVVLWIIITAVAVLESVLSFVLARRNNTKL